MKLAFRTLLVIAICAMTYLCVTSITVPIEFEQEQAKREQQIIKILLSNFVLCVFIIKLYKFFYYIFFFRHFSTYQVI